MNKKLKFVETAEGIFEVDERVRAGKSANSYTWQIVGFDYIASELLFYVRTVKKYGDVAKLGPTQSYKYIIHGGPQFFKIEKPKKLQKYKEPSGLYFDRIKGFDEVKSE